MPGNAERRPRPAGPSRGLKPGEESVWAYPRPPRLEPSARHIRVEFAGRAVADTHRAWRVLETSHLPVYYIPPEDVRMEYLKPEAGHSYCEWKGRASYYALEVGDRVAHRAAWTYREPTGPFAPIRDHLAFYAGPMDRCTVDGEKVEPQPGSFYGGWVTANIVGPFKGEPGTEGW
jgi:uncharacterized protein (DUF427 family)